MRTDALLRISIYTIELDGNSNGNIYDYADPTLLQRMQMRPHRPFTIRLSR